jgi:hypothetical protein
VRTAEQTAERDFAARVEPRGPAVRRLFGACRHCAARVFHVDSAGGLVRGAPLFFSIEGGAKRGVFDAVWVLAKLCVGAEAVKNDDLGVRGEG